MDTAMLLDRLNAPEAKDRLDALREICLLHREGLLPMPEATRNVNNHIHTTYSFSPYSPAKAAYMAWINGLTTAGIMDHDSVSGAEEFIEAGEILRIATTVGVELRCSFAESPFAGRRINNPDQNTVVYAALHGIPHQNLGRVSAFLEPYRAQRNVRNRKMTDNLNRILAPFGISTDFDRDILPLSNAHEGGSVTERHILFAVAGKMIARFGIGEPLVNFLREDMKLEVSEKACVQLTDPANEIAQYDLLGLLKSYLVASFYVDADAECPDVTEFIALADEVGAISAYAYLGDVGDSVTGDKRTQKFEDDYLDELVGFLAETGFRAVTYMPTRNTLPQLNRVMRLCEKNGLFQISGEDINSPRQSFVCEALGRPEFRHLLDSTWALIGHEAAATNRQEDGMFSARTRERFPDLGERIAYFAQIGKKSNKQ